MELVERRLVRPGTRYRMAVYSDACPTCSREMQRSKPDFGRQCKDCHQQSITKHGMRKHPTWLAWKNMRLRCTDRNRSQFKNYGGRGISVCAEWQQSAVFIEWALSNGWAPGLQLDRIDTDGNYEPANCRWVTQEINSQNRRKQWLNHETAAKAKSQLGEGQTVASVARNLGVPKMVITHLKAGRAWRNVA